MDAKQAKLAETLERLAYKIDSYHREKNNEVKQAAEVFNKLDSLVDSMSRLEAQESVEAKLAAKIDEMTNHIEKIIRQQQKLERQVEFEDAVRKVLHGAKITGKVIENVASSIDVMFETISKMLQDGYKGGAANRQTVESNGNFDLASFLKPLNSLIQGFASVGSSSDSNSGYSAGSREDGSTNKKSPETDTE